jgi:vesicle coat complex subunit
MEKLHGHTLEYWKNNAEEDYLDVPISVLKYLTCLEERIEQLPKGFFGSSLTIYMTYDEDDGEVFSACTSKERCDIEAEESETATQMTTLYFGERK